LVQILQSLVESKALLQNLFALALQGKEARTHILGDQSDVAQHLLSLSLQTLLLPQQTVPRPRDQVNALLKLLFVHPCDCTQPFLSLCDCSFVCFRLNLDLKQRLSLSLLDLRNGLSLGVFELHEQKQDLLFLRKQLLVSI
jgi:hypothetical protein